MISNEVGQSLHDRATRGTPLSPDEQAQLDAWYAHQDQEELQRRANAPNSHDLAELQAQIQRTAAQLVVQARHFQALTEDNARLRREIAALEKHLSDKLRTQGNPAPSCRVAC